MHICNDNAPAHEPDAVRTAARLLRAGGVVVYPTETLYGLGADALNPTAVARLAALKGRGPGKPISVLIGDAAMLADIVADVPPAAAVLMRRFWPGALTIVLRARPSLSPLLTGGGDGIGVRISSHPLATALVRALARPLTAPSANPAGMPPPTCIEAARAYFGERVDYYLDVGCVRGEPASTVVDARDGVTVLRAGAISVAALAASLQEVV